MQHEGKLISHQSSLGFLAFSHYSAADGFQPPFFLSTVQLGNSKREASLSLLSPSFESWGNEGSAAGDTDLEDGTCRPRKVPAALWWHFCEAVCSLAGSPYPAHIIKRLHSHKNLLLLILWKTYKIFWWSNLCSLCLSVHWGGGGGGGDLTL